MSFSVQLGAAWRVLLAALLSSSPLWRPCAGTYVRPSKYLLVTDAQTGGISYGKVSRSGNITEMRSLVSEGLIHPQGIAVDQKRNLLLVADSGLRKVVSYGLTTSGDSLLVDEQVPVAENVEARWVAVDSLGDVYFTDELGNRLMKVTVQRILDGDTTPEVVLAADSDSHISSPGGIASDNFYLYWTNKVNGNQVGSVVRSLLETSSNLTENRTQSGNETEPARVQRQTQKLATNVQKSYGVCLAIDNVIFTDMENNVYAVKRDSSDSPVVVTSALQNPRGCAWDGDSTVYIADRSLGGVYAMSAPMVSLAQADIRRVADAPDAFGVAVFSSARPALRPFGMVLALMLAALALRR